jgi:hypothetical protein
MRSLEDNWKISEYSQQIALQTQKKLEKQIEHALNNNNILSEITLEQYKKKYNSQVQLTSAPHIRKLKKEWDLLVQVQVIPKGF